MHFLCIFPVNPYMAAKNLTRKKSFFTFVNNSYSYWQKHTKLLPQIENMFLHVGFKFFINWLIFSIFPDPVPLHPVSQLTPLSPTSQCSNKKARMYLIPELKNDKQNSIVEHKTKKRTIIQKHWMYWTACRTGIHLSIPFCYR